ncbi:MAG: single-stranded DNA-binding protein [Clostridia bacterium]|nr:single-stranded DNA-binding protein [Clostridia bacterium]
MNKLTIIGNLTRDPESHTTPQGINVCNFTVAVNSRRRTGTQQDGQTAQQPQDEATFFRVTAWRQLGENCQKYLGKGRKVCVVGPVTGRTYTANDGTTRMSLDVTAEDVEFLTPRGEVVASVPYENAPAAEPAPTMQNSGFTNVTSDELPF